MDLRRKISFIFVFVLSVVLSSLFPNQTLAAEDGQLNLNVKSAILIDAKTGKILYKKNENLPLPPASMTKMMTEYLVMESLSKGKITWDDPVTTSDYGFFIASKKDSSGVFLNLGEKRTVRELYEAMAIYSANDATVMLAEYIAGTEENFVRMMNEKAKEFGMDNTHFLTSTGFPVDELGDFKPNIEGKHYMSAKDAAILARRLITDYPEVLSISSIPRKWFREGEREAIDMINWNWLLPGLKYTYEGADGLKTGYTAEAGYNFTATAQRGGLRLISVITGAETIDTRFEETKKLLNYGFNNFELVEMVPSGSQISGNEVAPVNKGKKLSVEVETKSPLMVLVKKGEKELYQPEVNFDQSKLTAPIQKGDVLGEIRFTYSGEGKTSFLTPLDEQLNKVELVAKENVERASWIRLFFRAIKDFTEGIFSGIVESISG
ncbi:D-alanyl-D-alanine carboxypeptidase [Microaerobacter geothermalis]|uniref:D-alanyl-D-alanine carboxypeptidase family protein n=1 Tax=Microaerobacter geothermalis TaxID=674972 RepID=UPI001F43F80C|nr:D-alanyl-D-alanine carboxypeptidase family protein [Microaerobacter geothermalis]MCF6095255.1 D-alanyl-D-alanine carboxypeptidase [Microaerobacter geothermalis]